MCGTENVFLKLEEGTYTRMKQSGDSVVWQNFTQIVDNQNKSVCFAWHKTLKSETTEVKDGLKFILARALFLYLFFI